MEKPLLPGMMWYILHFEIPEIDSFSGMVPREEKIVISALDNTEHPTDVMARAEAIREVRARFNASIILTSIRKPDGQFVYCI